MIDQVKGLVGAPDGLKEFMLSQLQQSVDHDVVDDDDIMKVRPHSTDDEWLQSELQSALRDVEYHAREYAKELSRTARRNAWLAQLHASLPPASAK